MADGITASSDTAGEQSAEQQAVERQYMDWLARELLEAEYDLLNERSPDRQDERSNSPADQQRSDNRGRERPEQYTRAFAPNVIKATQGAFRGLRAVYRAARSGLRRLRDSLSDEGPAAGAYERGQSRHAEGQGQGQRTLTDKQQRLQDALVAVSELSDTQREAVENAVLDRLKASDRLREAYLKNPDSMPLVGQLAQNAHDREVGYDRRTDTTSPTAAPAEESAQRWTRDPTSLSRSNIVTSDSVSEISALSDISAVSDISNDDSAALVSGARSPISPDSPLLPFSPSPLERTASTPPLLDAMAQQHALVPRGESQAPSRRSSTAGNGNSRSNSPVPAQSTNRATRGGRAGGGGRGGGRMGR